MTETANRHSAAANLRQRAETMIRQKDAQIKESLENYSSESLSRLIHDLRVHQIELEMQNEELRMAQLELTHSRERYFDLYDLAPVGYFLLSAQGLILEANLTFAAMLGVSKSSLLQQPLSRFILSQDQDLYYLRQKKIFETGEPTVCELRLQQNDGKEFWIQLETNSAQDVGRITFIRAMAVDISKRKMAEKALASSQARYRAFVDQSFEAMLMVDINTREIVEVNSRFSALLGYSLPEDAPLYANKIVVDSDDLDRIFNETLSNQRCLPTETRIFRHKNGTVVSVERTGTVVTVDDRSYLLKSVRDLTVERRRTTDMMKDVEVARRVQRGLLPELTESQFVSIRTLYFPSHFISGDSFFFEWCKKGKLLRGFLFDVSGHGIATALQTASINVLLKEAVASKRSLHEQISWANERSAKYFIGDSYAAIIGFELDFSLMELRYVGAGITQFFANGSKIRTPGMFVGLWDSAQFITGTLPVTPSDTFYFLTDGFTDFLAQPKNCVSLSTDGKDFDADVAALEQLAVSGKLRDDATGICLRIKEL